MKPQCPCQTDDQKQLICFIASLNKFRGVRGLKPIPIPAVGGLSSFNYEYAKYEPHTTNKTIETIIIANILKGFATSYSEAHLHNADAIMTVFQFTAQALAYHSI